MRRNSRRLSDPAWKSGPKERPPSSSEHALHPSSSGHDFDGFGQDESEMVDGEPLIAIQECRQCARDGCDAREKRRLLFTTEPLSDAEKQALDIARGHDSRSAHVHKNAERVDYETIEVGGTTITAEEIVTDEAKGSCYGRVEPDPEPRRGL